MGGEGGMGVKLSAMRKLVKRVKGIIRENIYNPFVSNLNNPHYLAMSFGVGTFFTLLPLVAQATFCFLAWLFMRRWKFLNFNIAIAVGLTFISNPLTDPFFFYGYYIFGVVVLGWNAYTFEDFVEKFKQIGELDDSYWTDFLMGVDFLADDVGLPIAVGGIIATIVGTILCYTFVFYISKNMKRKRAMLVKANAEKK